MAAAQTYGTHALPARFVTDAGYGVQVLAGRTDPDGGPSIDVRVGEMDEPVVTIDRSAGRVLAPILLALIGGRLSVELDAPCSACEGTGSVEDVTDRWSYSSDAHYTTSAFRECEACGGTGRRDELRILPPLAALANVQPAHARGAQQRAAVIDELLESTGPEGMMARFGLRPVSRGLVAELVSLATDPAVPAVAAGVREDG